MKKKRIIIGIVSVLVVLIIIRINNHGLWGEYNGKKKEASKGVVAFECEEYHNPKGGSGTGGGTGFSVVVKGNKMHVFSTNLAITGFYLYTREYVKEISESEIRDVKNTLFFGNWKHLCRICKDIYQSHDSEYFWTSGVSDDGSKLPDGRFKWEAFYDQLLVSDTEPERE